MNTMTAEFRSALALNEGAECRRIATALRARVAPFLNREVVGIPPGDFTAIAAALDRLAARFDAKDAEIAQLMGR